MKQVEHFTSFLTETVNLNDARIEQLETSVSALQDIIRNADWEVDTLDFVEYGSWALKTIIKPVGGRAFDADLLIIMTAVDEWTARDYVSALRRLFAEHGTYKGKVTRSSHCVTIEYAGERRVDLTPCIRNRNGVLGDEVCNFTTNTFERSAPEPYTTWLSQRNSWTGGNGLKKVTRLLKFLRDIKTTFSCPSVLLTTLLGMQITSNDEGATDAFNDVPTALKTIVGRLDDWLQARPTKPSVPNPTLVTEDLGELWDDSQYENFRDQINRYRSWIDDAFNEPDRNESISKWRRVFGDDFAAQAVTDRAVRVTHDARDTIARNLNLVLAPTEDLVGLVSRFGLRSLPSVLDHLPYKQQPKWRVSKHGQFSLVVTATRHARQFGPALEDVQSGSGPLTKGDWLRFAVRMSNGAMFGDQHQVFWRITNTDSEAFRAGCLRGGFEKANDGTSHWESLRYRGVHMAEAFVVRRREDTLVGQSKPFYVLIG